MKKASEATIEELVSDLSHWEDPSQMILIGPTEEGGIYVQDLEGGVDGIGPTLRDALLAFGRMRAQFAWFSPKNLDWRA